MGPKIPTKSWWETDTYDDDTAVPGAFTVLSGPKDLALVKAWPTGQTQQGWGLQGKDGAPGFMSRYEKDEFNKRRVLYGYNKGKWSFAFIMRSVNLICIDIDGKNGGIEHASELLGNAGPTLAETSKSGTGYHLYYATNEEWDPKLGFGAYNDAIGIVQGVDIRAVGCVYHHPQQRWNRRLVENLPKHIADKLAQRAAARAQQTAILNDISNLDEMEKIMMHDDLITELEKPLPKGKRNVTLYAIGHKLKAAAVPDWEDKVYQRGIKAGLPDAEVNRIVSNIATYVAP